MNIDRKAMTALRSQIEGALEELGKKHGIKFSLGNGKYSDGSTGSYTLEMATVQEDGTVMTQERKDFLRYARMFGLKETDIDREFTADRVLKIIGLKPKSRKFPVFCQEVGTDKFYKYPVNTVIAHLRMQDSQESFDAGKEQKQAEDDGDFKLTLVDTP